MATPPSQANSNSSQPLNRYYPSRGRGFHNRGARSQSRGRGRGNRGYPNRGFTYSGNSSNENNASNRSSNGDMKTGLFKDSFLEDPWKELIYKKKQDSVVKRQGLIDVHEAISDEEGEIILSDDEDESRENVVGLGDGIVEAAREVS
jgi:hypothetical protein